MIKLKSLRTKLLLIMAITSILPFVLLSTFLIYSISNGFSTLTKQDHTATKTSVINHFEIASKELLEVTEIYAQDKQLIEAYQTGSRNQLAERVRPVFERLQSEQKLTVFEFGDKNGHVFFRGHNPEKFGDNKFELPAIQSTLKGEKNSGFEFGSSGLAVRAFVPIIADNKVIGTLQTGIDDHFLETITQTTQGVHLNLYNQSGETIVSSDEEQIGSMIENQSTITKVLEGKELTFTEATHIQTLIPMYDPTKTEVIGMIGIIQDMTIINNVEQTTKQLTWIVGAITFLCIIIIATLYSKSISVPIKKVTLFMDELANGNISYQYDNDKRNDEIGLLSSSAAKLQNSYRQMVQQISDTSYALKSESKDLSNSSSEVNQASQQVAVTMQDLSNGAESQANSSLELSELMDGFSKKIHHVSKESEEMASTSKQMLELTDYGQQLMSKSIDEMGHIHTIVENSVQRVKNLDDQAEQITGMIKVIQDIANQTNLLALNAAIEAARAGEHGRGFSIVADEVRKLSEQVKESVNDITNTVISIQDGSKLVTASLEEGFKKVSLGTKQIETTGNTFEKITGSISDMIRKFNDISETLIQVDYESKTIHTTVESIASISEEFAAGIEETAASTQQTSSSMEQINRNVKMLEKVSQELNETLQRFKI